MSTFRQSFFRKRRSDDESSESDSDEEGPPVKKTRHSNGDTNIKNSLATRFKSLLEWVAELPVSSYFKESLLRNSSFLKQPLEAVILDQMDDDNQDEPDIIEIEDEDPTTSSSARRECIPKDFLLPTKPFTSSTPFYRDTRSLREAASNHLHKPVNGFHNQPNWMRKEGAMRKTRSQQRNAPLSNPGTDVEILLDTRNIPADESDDLEIVSEVTHRKQPNTRSCKTISPVYKSRGSSSSRSIGAFSHKGMVNGKTSSTPYLRKEKQIPSNQYTAHEVVRLQEKHQYKLLLDKMINDSIYHPVVRKESKPVEIQVDLTDDDEPVIAAPIKKEILQQPVKDFLKKYYKPCQLVCPVPPPTVDELDKIDDAIASSEDDVQIIKEVTIPEYKPKTKKKTDLSEWIAELKMTVNAETESRLHIVRQQEEKVERYKKRRDAKLAEETHLRDQLKLSGAISNICLEDETEFPDLTAEMEMAIDAALDASQPPSEKLSELPEEKVQVCRSDLFTLTGLNWLNDEIINFYLALIAVRSKQNDKGYPKVHSYNSFFYTALKNRGESRVLRWTKNVDIFAHDLLIYPLHLGMHWALCVIDNRSKKIKYYDSMQSSEEQCLRYLQNYIVCEMKDKKKIQMDPNTYSTEVVKDIPQQMNGSDCGMFTLKYAEYISRDAPITFTQENMQYFRRKMVYEIITRQLL